MSSRLAGKNVLVTGASRGIGRAIALRLASEGALLAVHYGHDRAAAADTVAAIEATGGSAFPIGCELAVVHGIADMFARLDHEFEARSGRRELDILINNAAVCVGNHIAALGEDEVDLQLAVNIKGLLFVTQHSLPRFPARGGSIVNLSSWAALRARPHVLAYAATKGAVDTLTVALAEELGPRGITVNAVAPGMTRTEMTLEMVKKNPGREQQVIGQTALRRLGAPEDIADVVAFLVSQDARWLTGQIICATGGWNLS